MIPADKTPPEISPLLKLYMIKIKVNRKYFIWYTEGGESKHTKLQMNVYDILQSWKGVNYRNARVIKYII